MGNLLLANLTIFEQGIEAARSVSQSWDLVWKNTLGGSTDSGFLLYGAICNIGVLFAVGSLIFFGVQLFKELKDGKYDSASMLIWPFVVGTLLANHGTLLATITMEIREIFNSVNDYAVSVAYNGARLDELYRQAQSIGNAQQAVQGYLNQCISLTGEQQVQCLSHAVDQSQALVDSYGDAFGITQRLRDLVQTLSDLKDQITKNPGSLLTVQNPLFWSLFGPAWEQVVYGILWAWQLAFQTGVEVSLLLTAIIGPLAVGGTILPIGAKPLYAWITGLFSIAILKLSFNIVAGLSAAMFVNSKSTDPLFFPIFLGIFAPLVAGAIAAGGGLAVWAAIVNGVRTTISFLAR